ncbi:unnamed protein product [Discosporangium mesarthrocarpum]
MTDCNFIRYFLVKFHLPIPAIPSFLLMTTKITGALVYLQSCTRPDLGFSVPQLARHMNRSSTRHMIATKRTLCYIQGKKYTSLTCQRGHFKLHGYADAAYATDEDTSHSMSGCIFFLGNAALSWSSHKQSLVT